MKNVFASEFGAKSEFKACFCVGTWGKAKVGSRYTAELIYGPWSVYETIAVTVFESETVYEPQVTVVFWFNVGVVTTAGVLGASEDEPVVWNGTLSWVSGTGGSEVEYFFSSEGETGNGSGDWDILEIRVVIFVTDVSCDASRDNAGSRIAIVPEMVLEGRPRAECRSLCWVRCWEESDTIAGIGNGGICIVVGRIGCGCVWVGEGSGPIAVWTLIEGAIGLLSM